MLVLNASVSMFTLLSNPKQTLVIESILNKIKPYVPDFYHWDHSKPELSGADAADPTLSPDDEEELCDSGTDIEGWLM